MFAVPVARLQAEEGISDPFGLPASTKGPSSEGSEGFFGKHLSSELHREGFCLSILVTSLDSVVDQDVSSQKTLPRSSAVFQKPRKSLPC